MVYRDEREALRARIENLEQEIEQTKETAIEDVLFPKKTPRQRIIRAAIAGSVIAAVVAGGFGLRVWEKRAAERDISAAWSHLSACLVGEPLGPSETAAARARRIQLADVSQPPGMNKRWPWRCEGPAQRLHEKLRKDGSADEGGKDGARPAETLATKLKQGIDVDDFLDLLDPLFKQMQERGIVAAEAVGEMPPPRPASPLHLGDLKSAAITTVETPAANIYVEPLPGPDRHVLIDSAKAGPAVLCTIKAQADAVTCRPLPGDLGKKHGLRLLGATAPGAAPLVFAGHEGADGIYRSDTGELVASVRAYSAYSAADGYVAIQSWPEGDDGHFDVLEQRGSRAEVKKTTVKPDAQKQPVTTIHRSRLVFDKAVIQVLDQKNLKSSPWFAYKTLAKEDLGGAFTPIGDLNWINATITGCRGTAGIVVRIGPNEAYLLFNEGDKWQGPLAERGLGELRCDGADAVFLSSWPLQVKRCTPAGCDDQTPPGGSWPMPPRKGMSAFEVVDGKVAAAWATDHHGVRFRIATPSQIGHASDIVVFDDVVAADGKVTRASVLSGIHLVAAGPSTVLFLATSEGVRAIRLNVDGTFAPATIAR